MAMREERIIAVDGLWHLLNENAEFVTVCGKAFFGPDEASPERSSACLKCAQIDRASQAAGLDHRERKKLKRQGQKQRQAERQASAGKSVRATPNNVGRGKRAR